MTKLSEKEKEAKLKVLRKELAHEISEQLPPEIATERPRAEKAASEKTPKIQSDQEAKHIIEAILFTASKPVAVSDLKRALGAGYGEGKIENLVRELQSEYETEGRSFHILEIAGGFECATDPKFAPWILKLELQRRQKQATQSALETLAILAYKQPITRSEIEDLRGVDASGVLQTLMERNLIKIVGKKEVPGHPFLYGTTDKFLEHFGLKSIQDLPDISEIKSLIENSVKRDELLRTEKIITTEEGKSNPNES
ncbi:MAG: SMC-Scp complex subunit ScpB [Candidatus Omnitrophica bacterium]|nr:SMC-Scp complex subunit ScpB [Candidatus Omnitrophota bacterium]